MVQELRVEVLSPGTVLELSGRLDRRTSDQARERLHDALGAGEGDLELRIRDLELWDAGGLGVLIGAQRLARRRGRRVVLTEASQRHLRLLRAVRLHRVLPVEPAAVA